MWHFYLGNTLVFTPLHKTVEMGKANIRSKLLDQESYLFLHVGTIELDFVRADICIDGDFLYTSIGRDAVSRSPK